MRNKLIVILIALGILFLISGGDNQDVHDIDDMDLISDTLESREPESTVLSSGNGKKESEMPTIVEVEDQTEDEGSDNEKSSEYETIYDPDPVVDARFILQQYALCFRYMKATNSSRGKVNLDRVTLKMNPLQSKFFTDYYGYCKGVEKTHQGLNFNNIEPLRQQASAAEASSIWGKILNSEISEEDLTESEIGMLIKQNNPAVLSLAPSILKNYYNNVIHWDLEYILQNHQYDYVLMIQDYAHQFYLCQQGMECGPESTFMAKMCFMSVQSCGLSFSEFIEKVLTTGQKSDLQLAVKYFYSRYQ